MIVSFYDKNFVPLQNNASLNVSNWSLKRKAVDLDDFTATCEPFLENINPTFVIMADDRGRYKYGAFAGVPQLTNANQTEIQATDLKNYFNNTIYIQFGTYTTVADLFQAVTTAFMSQVNQSSFTIDFVMTDISSVNLATLVPNADEYQTINVWEDIFKPYMKYYNLFMTSQLDIVNKKIIYTFSRTDKVEKTLHLYEYGYKNYGKWVASLNECQTILLTPTQLYTGTPYILLNNNVITSDLTIRDLYPIKKDIVLKEIESDDPDEVTSALSEGVAECIGKLAEARFNESVEIDVNNTPYENDEFTTSYNIYTSRGVFYKKLPLGIISEANTGKKVITIGYKADDLILYL